MVKDQLGAKERILKAAMDILEEEKEIDKITVRRIAEKAQVGTGLINYHFQSREKLLNEAIGITMTEIAGQWMRTAADKSMDPAGRLKKMLKELTDFGMRYQKFIQISASYELLQGDMETPLYLVPILRELYGSKKDERELRIIALALISSIQTIFLRADNFKSYAGYDIFDAAQRNKVIDILLDNFL